VLVAGGFGSALKARDLVELGVLPAEYASRVRVIGNASLLGAAMIAIDPSLEAQASDLVALARHVELASDPAFNQRFLGALDLGPYSLG
jgi:uncharacterized 2Fe-2S/4Fe-4S cluster protein (DUF4445 family)